MVGFEEDSVWIAGWDRGVVSGFGEHFRDGC